jgi:hypothetical protein
VKIGNRKTTAAPGKLRSRLTYANVISTAALFLALGGGAAFAASHLVLPKNSVGSRQIKRKAVNTGKIANNAVNGQKVANGSLTGEDINLNALGTVPSAVSASHAADADALGGHTASCPGGAILIRGICFDSSPGPQLSNVTAAADACASKGGWLPTPLELYSIRGVINLGTGVGADNTFTDVYYANTSGVNYSTVVVNGTGAIAEQPVTSPGHAVCAYPLVR